MELLENRFAIRRITKSCDEDYILALRIYNETTPTDIKTNTNEITHWLDQRNDSQPFQLMLFALYLDSRVIGFAMMSYIETSRVVVIDYIAISDPFRVNAVFFPYISLLQSYLNESGYDVAYIVNEVSNKDDGKSIDKESRLFKRLFCMEGFGRIDARYYTPPLGNSNHESIFAAFLYVKSSDDIKSLSANTYLDIVRSIYNDYFIPWYRDFFSKEDISIYEHKIIECMRLIEKSLQTNRIVNVIYADCPILAGSHDGATYGVLPVPQKKRFPSWPFLLALILICPLMIIWLYTLLLDLIGIPMNAVATIIGSCMSAAITAISATLIAKKKS